MIIIYLCECVPLFYFEIAYTKIREMNKKINKNPKKSWSTILCTQLLTNNNYKLIDFVEQYDIQIYWYIILFICFKQKLTSVIKSYIALGYLGFFQLIPV